MSRYSALFVLLLVAAFTTHAEDENPFLKAKVGDWTQYKVANKMAGMSMEMEMKSTLVSKTDSEATVEVVTKMADKEFKSSYKVNLNEKYDARSTGLKDVTMRETGKGEETLTVGGKSIKTNWTSFEVIGKTPDGTPIASKGKAWVSSEVPLNGLVKSEGEMVGAGTQKMELTAFGNGK